VEIPEDGDEPLPHFTLVVYTGGKAYPKDFPCPVVIDLDGLDIPSQKIPIRYEHKSYQGVGHTEKIEIIGHEVIAEGVISRDTSWARDVAQSAKNGFPWQASMGGPIHETEYVPFGQTVVVNGQTFEGELYVIRNMTLKEISFVDLAADENTSAVIEAQYEEKLQMADSRQQAAGGSRNNGRIRFQDSIAHHRFFDPFKRFTGNTSTWRRNCYRYRRFTL